MMEPRKMLFRPVNDPMQIPGALNELQDELIDKGHDVQPRGGPVVIVKLDDGEIHYVPGEGGIWQYVFSS